MRIVSRMPDKIDFQGTKYWYCGIHEQWWTDYCPHCHPTTHKIHTIVADVIAGAIVGAVFILLIVTFWGR